MGSGASSESKNEIVIRMLQPSLTLQLCGALAQNDIYVTAISENQDEGLVWIRNMPMHMIVSGNSLFGFGISQNEVYRPKGSKQIHIPHNASALEIDEQVQSLQNAGSVVVSRSPPLSMPRYIYVK